MVAPDEVITKILFLMVTSVRRVMIVAHGGTTHFELAILGVEIFVYSARNCVKNAEKSV